MHFTAREQRLVDALPGDGSRISSTALITAIYGDGSDQPFNARQIIISGMRGIVRKTTLFDFGFRVHRTPRAGPNPIEFWRR